MSPTLFDPPYSCTETEYRRLSDSDDSDELARMRALDLDPSASDDHRWTAIYDLCALRGDAAGMRHALEQITDRAWAAELACRDIILDLSEWPD